jgi:uncharacterized RDD family membrane protein YckC
MVKAPLGKRIVAYVLDMILVSVIYMVLLILGAIIGRLLDIAVISLLFLFIAIAIGAIYLLLRDALFSGQSVGKKLMGVKVINTVTNKQCSFKDSILRNITWFIPVIGLIDLILPLIDKEGLRLGDKLAKTQVVA